ncbi:Histidinol-phosphate aminotransferase [Paraliobacillus sp. PM-2]|uniref:histidinol-phosphate transaminase n=1 Tax=Paraliobacillus sp. PM-2 TaxID=1462524 RepID=UPI00061C3583|nr:histidinol-phosphate transaminase [Paraliobacillus sp. PM-2]CQR46686.1 Histidinol-phosphate aminotransferase [Paraliobacillus sp. PM-2]
MNGKEVLKQMKPYKPGKQIEDVKKEYGLSRIIKLASNENPFGYSDKVKSALPTLATHFELYPDGYATQLREELTENLNVEKDQLVFGCGSDEVVDMICRTFLEPGTNTVIANPTFPQYKHNALIQGATVKEVPVIDGYHDLEAMLQAIDSNTKVVWLCTPNNPTGCLIKDASLEYFMTNCPEDVLVVVDEAYYEYVTATDAPETIKWINKYPNLVVLRTFSKAYGLAALRVGYGVATEEIANLLNITRGPFNTTTVAQQAAVIALRDREFLQNSVNKTTTNKKQFLTFLEDLGLSYYDSEANFVFVKLPITGDELFEHLLTKGFIVRSGEALGHPYGVRITIGHEQDMKELQELMDTYLRPVIDEGKS